MYPYDYNTSFDIVLSQQNWEEVRVVQSMIYWAPVYVDTSKQGPPYVDDWYRGMESTVYPCV